MFEEATVFEHEFETVSCDNKEGYDPFYGVGLNTTGHQEIIRRGACEGWRYVGCIPVKQRREGLIEALELVSQRERRDA